MTDNRIPSPRRAWLLVGLTVAAWSALGLIAATIFFAGTL